MDGMKNVSVASQCRTELWTSQPLHGNTGPVTKRSRTKSRTDTCPRLLASQTILGASANTNTTRGTVMPTQRM